MTYVSRPVRRIRADPIEGETAELLVHVAEDGDPDRVAAAVREAGGEVRGDRGFGALAAEVPQEAVEAVCGIDGLAAVETAGVLTMDLDGAGEDVTY